jgi:quercetin 2,3-dioxygenase
MIAVRKATARGYADHGWLRSFHTFSFADYYDPGFMGFRTLRVINEDRVQPGKGFATHGHENMEILSYVLEGALEHRDSLGNGSVIRPGDVQRMSAGTGVRHSEFNPSDATPVHFLQIWILPAHRGLAPSYEQRTVPAAETDNLLGLIASQDGRAGSVTVHQDVSVYAVRLEPARRVRHPVDPGRHVWVQVARGTLAVNGVALGAGDGAALSGEQALELAAETSAEAVVFELA